MKRAVAIGAAALAIMPLGLARAADVLAPAETTAQPKAASRAAPPPALPVPDPLLWAALLVGGVALAGAVSRRRPEPRIRITFD